MNNNVEGRVAVESKRIGAGGDQLLAQITGLDEKTRKPGRQELTRELSERPEQRVRLPGAGRPRAEKKTQRDRALEALVQPETAGDPNSRAEMGAHQSAPSQPALGGGGASCQSTNGRSSVTQVRLLLAGECEKARGQRRPP